jgi:hypothetical protein
MSEAKQDAGFEAGGFSREQRTSAIFASLVVNQTQMALMLLGKLPHPGTGQTTKDLEGARLFIDQLEMLEEKTKGNLDQNERKLLRDHLTALHMAFVEAAEEGVDSAVAKPSPAELDKAGEAGESPRVTSADAAESASAGEGDSRKKFSKKY